MWSRQGGIEEALADYTRVIELPGAPVEELASALMNRGNMWLQKGDTNKELADYTRVIEQLPGAPVEHVATGLAARGWLQYRRNAYNAFLTDTEAALSKVPALSSAMFNLGLALLACGRDNDALAAHERAATLFPDRIEEGLVDLADAQKTWLTGDRARPNIAFLSAAMARRA